MILHRPRAYGGEDRYVYTSEDSAAAFRRKRNITPARPITVLRMRQLRRWSVVLVLLLVAIVAIGPAIHNHSLSAASHSSRSLTAFDLCVLCVAGSDSDVLTVLTTAVTLAFLFSIAAERSLVPAMQTIRIRASRAPPVR
jgi:CDP-diglyceride synthetase